MSTATPFSFSEIEALEDFDLNKPCYLTMSDGIDCTYYNFVGADHKNIVILYAGAGLYGNKIYQWVAKKLYEQHGIGCYIFDIRGHGHSQGPRGDAPSITRVWQDVAEAIRFVKNKHNSAKIYLAGHSSGAGLIINYAANAEYNNADGYIFLAPYLGPKSNTIRTHTHGYESFVKKVRPWLYVVGAMFPYSWIIHRKVVFFNYPDNVLQRDPLIVSDYTYVMSCATTPYEIESLLKKLDKPVALFMGNDDEQFISAHVIAYKSFINAPVLAVNIEGAAHLSILLNAPQLIADYISSKIT